MKEELFLEKIVLYEKESEIKKIIFDNIKKNYFLVRHSTNDKKLFFKNFETPHSKIFGGP